MQRYVKTFESFIAEKNSDVVAIATTHNGDVDVTRSDIKEYLTDLKNFWDADNFPKWLLWSKYSNAKTTKKRYVKAEEILQTLLTHTGQPIKYDVKN